MKLFLIVASAVVACPQLTLANADPCVHWQRITGLEQQGGDVRVEWTEEYISWEPRRIVRVNDCEEVVIFEGPGSDVDDREFAYEDNECQEDWEDAGDFYYHYVVYDECVPLAETTYRLKKYSDQFGEWRGVDSETIIITDQGQDCGICEVEEIAEWRWEGCTVVPGNPAGVLGPLMALFGLLALLFGRRR